jgi:hypothetical protein
MRARAGRRALKPLFAATVLLSSRPPPGRLPTTRDEGSSAGEIALRQVEVEFRVGQGSVPFRTGVQRTEWSGAECAEAADEATSGPAVVAELAGYQSLGHREAVSSLRQITMHMFTDEGQAEVMILSRVRPVRHAAGLADAISRRPDEILRNVVGPLSALYAVVLLRGQEHGSDDGHGVPPG